MTKRIQSTYIDDTEDEYPAKVSGYGVDVWDMSKNQHIYHLLLGYGNGLYQESRIVGESEDALELFRGLMRGGGYTQVANPEPGKRWLYQPGDECFGHIVFIDPIPRPDLFDAPTDSD